MTAGTVAAVVGRRLARRHPAGTPATVVGSRRAADAGHDRWHCVTINREPEEVGALPPPLDDLGLPVEVNVRPAPGGRGTELAARLTGPLPTGRAKADDPVRALRRALREARSLAEIGEVLLPNTPPTTRRTLTGAPLAYATRHGREEGRL